MKERSFKIVHFPNVLAILALLISSKDREINVGIATFDEGEFHFITVKVLMVQLCNSAADKPLRRKRRGKKQILRKQTLNLYGECFDKKLRGRDRCASIYLEYDPASKTGIVKVRTTFN